MRRFIVVVFIVFAMLWLGGISALATHTHVRVLGNGKCVIIAASGGEKDVVLPGAVFQSNPNVDVAPTAGRSHPLHVLVHLGVPGDVGQLYVYGSAAGNAACAAGYVNP